METRTKNLLIDVFNILPDHLECFIQAPSLENVIIQNMLEDSPFNYFKLLRLDKIKKRNIIEQEISSSFAVYIQNIQIKKDKDLLFEGFDGVEFGTLSKAVLIPNWFKELYIPHICTISHEW